MTAISVIPCGTAEGKQVVRAVIVANTAPAELPTTGDGIIGMNEDQVFAPMSILYVAGESESKVYVTGESGIFIPQ